MIRNSIDVASRVSPRLAALLDSRINDPDIEQPITLSNVRHFLADLLPADFKEAEHMLHFDVDVSMLDELDGLIEEYGDSAFALDFVPANASEQLSRVIEAVVNDENRENPPTLATVRDALVNGLGAHLVREDEKDVGTARALGRRKRANGSGKKVSARGVVQRQRQR